MVVRRVVKRRKKRFPFLGALLVLIGVVWILQQMGTVGNFPWIASILVLLGIAFIYNRL